MAKQKKKRNKSYKGATSSSSRSSITHISAVQRSKTGQWWFDNRSRVRIFGIALLTIIVIVLIISGIVDLIN